jgi:hypothetical protein
MKINWGAVLGGCVVAFVILLLSIVRGDGITQREQVALELRQYAEHLNMKLPFPLGPQVTLAAVRSSEMQIKFDYLIDMEDGQAKENFIEYLAYDVGMETCPEPILGDLIKRGAILEFDIKGLGGIIEHEFLVTWLDCSALGFTEFDIK